MTEATASGFYERQRALRQRLHVLEAALVAIAGPEDGAQLAWFSPVAPEPMRPKPLPWCR